MDTLAAARSRRRPLRIALLALAVLLLVAGALVYYSTKAPPECARLLPESQGMVYFNLRPLRAATHFDRHPVRHDADYQRFIDATGINFERDLDEAAFALHRTADPLGPNGPVAYSEVFVGHYDATRLQGFLKASASSQETYAGHTIYSIPSDGRTVRATLLGKRMVAVSNTPTSEQVHSILDRYRTDFLPTSGSTLLSEHYRDVPLLSLAWGLGQIGLPFGDHGEFRVMGLTLPWKLDSIFIASLRWTGALRLRIEQIAPTESAATVSAGAMDGLVTLGRLAENNLPGSLANENARALLNSATVTHYGDRAVLNATLPTHFFEKLMTPPESVVPAPR
jgi:hypothetical protein